MDQLCLRSGATHCRSGLIRPRRTKQRVSKAATSMRTKRDAARGMKAREAIALNSSKPEAITSQNDAASSALRNWSTRSSVAQQDAAISASPERISAKLSNGSQDSTKQGAELERQVKDKTNQTPPQQSPRASRTPRERISSPGEVEPARDDIASLVRREPTPEKDPRQIAHKFNPIKAYEQLRATRIALRHRYNELNSGYLDALERKEENHRKEQELRQKRGTWVLVRESLIQPDGPRVKEDREHIFEDYDDTRFYDDPNDYREEFTNDSERDRGEEPGMGGPIDEMFTDDEQRLTYYDPDVEALHTFRREWVPDERDLDSEEELDEDMRQEKYEWQTASSASTPNSLFNEDLADVKQAATESRLAASKLWDEMRAVRMEEACTERMIQALQKQFPYLLSNIALPRKTPPSAHDGFQEGKTTYEHTHQTRARANNIPVSHRPDVKRWHASIAQTLRTNAHANLEAFPAPPHWKCDFFVTCHDRLGSLRTMTQAPERRLLRACEHNVRDACAGLTAKELREYRRMWHPDRFVGCRTMRDGEDVRTWAVKANEIFVVVGAMWEERVREGREEGDFKW